MDSLWKPGDIIQLKAEKGQRIPNGDLKLLILQIVTKPVDPKDIAFYSQSDVWLDGERVLRYNVLALNTGERFQIQPYNANLNYCKVA